MPALDDAPWMGLIAGIGGSGVVTLGQLLGAAAHYDGVAVSVLNASGLAHKGGTVICHVALARDSNTSLPARVPPGRADCMLGTDAIASASDDAMNCIRPRRTHCVISTAFTPTAQFAHDPNWQYPLQDCMARIEHALGARAPHDDGLLDTLDAQFLAKRLLGDAVYAGMLLLGWAWQKGWIPLSRRAIVHAIGLHGVQVSLNQSAFEWGRRAAHDLPALHTALRSTSTIKVVDIKRPSTLDDTIARYATYLSKYQSARYAKRYAQLIERLRNTEGARLGRRLLTEAAASSLFKLMAYKDEYEVARLYCEPAFKQALHDQFEGPYDITLHIAPPFLAHLDDAGRPLKRAYGRWIFKAFRVIAFLRFIRGTWVDPFRKRPERQMERALIAEFTKTLEEIMANLSHNNHGAALAYAQAFDAIKGFGHIKQKHVDQALRLASKALAQFRGEAQRADDTTAEAATIVAIRR